MWSIFSSRVSHFSISDCQVLTCPNLEAGYKLNVHVHMYVCAGVYGLPHCSGDTYTICNYVRKLLTVGAYLE